MSKKKDEVLGRSPDAYTPPPFRGVLITLIVAAIGIVLVWWAYVSVVAEGNRRTGPAADGPTIGADGTATLVLADIPKYGLARPHPHSYALPRSGPDPTPEHHRGPDSSRSRARARR